MRPGKQHHLLSRLVLLLLVTEGCTYDPDANPSSRVYRNVSPAMAPTLRDRAEVTVILFADSASVARDLRRGDIVAHAWPLDTTKKYLKRVLGFPGDTIGMRGGTLWLNGQPLSEPYAWHAEPEVDPVVPEMDWQRHHLEASASNAYQPSRNNWGPLILPAGSYFVLGDNRDNSFDSRYWGFLTAAHILGRVVRDSGGRVSSRP